MNIPVQMHPEDELYSIERLSCYYIDFDEQRKTTDPKQKIYDKIGHAMKRLDELWDGNDFDNGDTMRINEVHADLRYIKTILLEQEEGRIPINSEETFDKNL